MESFPFGRISPGCWHFFLSPPVISTSPAGHSFQEKFRGKSFLLTGQPASCSLPPRLLGENHFRQTKKQFSAIAFNVDKEIATVYDLKLSGTKTKPGPSVLQVVF
jgi:hypothetical protein